MERAISDLSLLPVFLLGLDQPSLGLLDQTLVQKALDFRLDVRVFPGLGTNAVTPLVLDLARVF